MDSLCEYNSDDGDEPRAQKPNPGVRPTEENVLVHVYVIVQGRGLAAFVRRLMGMARLALVNRLVKASFTQHTSFHVSIARATSIPLSQVNKLASALRSGFASEKGGTITLEARVVALLSASTRRLYVAAPLDQSSSRDVVLPLIAKTDAVYGQFGLPCFHEDPRPHMSFASTESTAVQAAFDDDGKPSGESFSTGISAVVCDIGKSQMVFPLNQRCLASP